MNIFFSFRAIKQNKSVHILLSGCSLWPSWFSFFFKYRVSFWSPHWSCLKTHYATQYGLKIVEKFVSRSPKYQDYRYVLWYMVLVFLLTEHYPHWSMNYFVHCSTVHFGYLASHIIELFMCILVRVCLPFPSVNYIDENTMKSKTKQNKTETTKRRLIYCLVVCIIPFTMMKIKGEINDNRN